MTSTTGDSTVDGGGSWWSHLYFHFCHNFCDLFYCPCICFFCETPNFASFCHGVTCSHPAMQWFPLHLTPLCTLVPSRSMRTASSYVLVRTMDSPDSLFCSYQVVPVMLSICLQPPLPPQTTAQRRTGEHNRSGIFKGAAPLPYISYLGQGSDTVMWWLAIWSRRHCAGCHSGWHAASVPHPYWWLAHL